MVVEANYRAGADCGLRRVLRVPLQPLSGVAVPHQRLGPQQVHLWCAAHLFIHVARDL